MRGIKLRWSRMRFSEPNTMSNQDLLGIWWKSLVHWHIVSVPLYSGWWESRRVRNIFTLKNESMNCHHWMVSCFFTDCSRLSISSMTLALGPERPHVRYPYDPLTFVYFRMSLRVGLEDIIFSSGPSRMWAYECQKALSDLAPARGALSARTPSFLSRILFVSL